MSYIILNLVKPEQRKSSHDVIFNLRELTQLLIQLTFLKVPDHDCKNTNYIPGLYVFLYGNFHIFRLSVLFMFHQTFLMLDFRVSKFLYHNDVESSYKEFTQIKNSTYGKMEMSKVN